MITPIIVTKDEKHLIGVEARTSNAAETNLETAKIPALWQRFFQVVQSIPHRKNSNIIYGTYTKYASDHHGEYSLIIASEVKSLGSVPDGMVTATLVAGRYRMFVAQGQMPQALIETWGQIWNNFTGEGEDERAYTTDYEVHDMNNDTRVEVYIALK